MSPDTLIWLTPIHLNTLQCHWETSHPLFLKTVKSSHPNRAHVSLNLLWLFDSLIHMYNYYWLISPPPFPLLRKPPFTSLPLYGVYDPLSLARAASQSTGGKILSEHGTYQWLHRWGKWQGQPRTVNNQSHPGRAGAAWAPPPPACVA